jgi:ion channel-forming bestrophin family protein
MKIGKSYRLVEFLTWTRRKIYILLVMAIISVALYEVLGQKWISAPWSVALLFGTATSFIVGFKNAQTYNRMLEAQQVWAAIAARADIGDSSAGTFRQPRRLQRLSFIATWPG